MAVSGTSGTTGAGTTAGTDRKMLANNFDQFLTLLTTQLKNQNPLEPLDTNQFTQQLVQFASVEQQIKSNTTLASPAAGDEGLDRDQRARFRRRQRSAPTARPRS